MVWDWIIIGSGFGGSVSALRLAEKGYSVLVLEKGQRWEAQDYPKSNWNLKRWLWMPAVGFRGFFKMTFFRHLTALSGVGVGGGSLVYANTLPTPPGSFFQGPEWKHLADWEEELAPHYQTARRMLGVTPNPLETAPDRALKAVAERLGRSEHFQPTQVGVYFGVAGVTEKDPYHGGEGPERTGCTHCGGCMVGCRYGAKNTLDKNYLWLAEKRGATVLPDTEVTWVRPFDGHGMDGIPDSSGASVSSGPSWSKGPHPEAGLPARFVISARERRRAFRAVTHQYQARNIVFSGGVLGTVDLLLRLRRSTHGLPELSQRVGDRVRTNSEVLIGVTTQRRDLDLAEGVAITSILQTDDDSSIEPCRFSPGSGFFRLLATPHAPGRSLVRRVGNGIKRFLGSPVRGLRALFVPDFARYTTALLYMRTLEGYLRLSSKRGLFRHLGGSLRSEPGDGPLPTAAIPEATALADEYAKEVDGHVGSLLTETLLGIPTTAHILGGACMGANRDQGVIDDQHQIFGYEGLYVVDGSAVSANPGVNPSLTITALAERAMSFVPEKEARVE